MSNQLLNCIVCQEKAKLICFCSNISLCEKCIGKHLLDNPSISHKPVPLSDLSLSPKYTQNLEDLNKEEEKFLRIATHQQEVINAIQSKLANEILELDEFKNISLQVIAEFIKSVQREVADASKFINNFVNEKCNDAQKELRNALVLLKLSHDSNHPILSLLLRCKSVEEVRNIDITKKDLKFKELGIKDSVKDAVYFCFDILKDNTIMANRLPQAHPGDNADKHEPIRKSKIAVPGSRLEKNGKEASPIRLERALSDNAVERLSFSSTNGVPRKAIPVPVIQSVKAENIDSHDASLKRHHSRDILVISHSKTVPSSKNPFRESRSSVAESPSRKLNLSLRSSKSIELGVLKGRLSVDPRMQQISSFQKSRSSDPLPPSLYCFIPESSRLIIYNTSTKDSEEIIFENDIFYSKSSWGVSEDGKLILTGGYDGNALKHTFMYNLYDKFTEKVPNLMQARYNHAQVALGNYVYALGGFNTNPMKDCERLNLNTKKWQKTGNLNIARDCHAACVHSGRIFVAGGSGIDSIEAFNAVSEKFSLIRVRLSVPGRCCMFPHNKTILLFQRKKAIRLCPTSMSCTEISTIQEAEWWTPGDPVITDEYVYFITQFNAFKFQSETGIIELEYTFNL
ncbi:unnamed protein product [Blepharisma stoltei]|uniref:B box-type domain-containing protein n=1 Tax=Blepharisma stoltei TaxID=1481888 RepID=A0AAU9IPJ1_9CILI|nr:unnamed protein product [Blepharisma stoltei]